MKTFACMTTVLCMALAFCVPPAWAEADAQGKMIQEMRREIQNLRREMERQRQVYERKMECIKRRLEAMGQPAEAGKGDGEAALKAALAKKKPGEEGDKKTSPLAAAVQKMNPDASIIIDTIYYNDDRKNGFAAISPRMAGFGHTHPGGEEEEHDHGLSKGINLRHLELGFSAQVDPYFKGYANVAVSEEGAEIHEAYIDTSSLPWGFKLRVGKFFSNFSRINGQHSHEWDFVDAPLIYTLALGEHRLLDKGLQISWLAPLKTHLLLGLEILQGDNEVMFTQVGGDHLPEKDGPRLWVGWLKWSPALTGGHGMQLGPYAALGVHQEVHDGDGDGEEDHWLDGESRFFGMDLVYKYNSGRAYGQGNFIFQADYFRRYMDLTVQEHDLVPAYAGRERSAVQDGYYVQAVYGFAPRWRGGLRWEQVGLTNRDTYPSGSTIDHDASWRMTAMIDFSPSEFSRLRLQAARGTYALDDGTDEDAWQFWLQFQISLGSHGAHKF